MWSLLVHSIAQELRLSTPTIERTKTRSSLEATIERTPHNTEIPALPQPITSLLRHENSEQLRALKRTFYDRAHIGMRSSALATIKRTHVTWQYIIFLINRTYCIFVEPTFVGAFQESKTLCLSLLSLPFIIYFISFQFFMIRG